MINNYAGLTSIYSENVASGLYYTYTESEPDTQMLVLGLIQDYTQVQMGEILGISEQRLLRRLASFRSRMLARVPTMSGHII
jgi:hypothetical protein